MAKRYRQGKELKPICPLWPLLLLKAMPAHSSPAPTASSTIPIIGNTSRVRGNIPSAFEVEDGAGALSTIRHRTPWRASSQAIVNPTGPAPTTRTSLADFMGFDSTNVV